MNVGQIKPAEPESFFLTKTKCLNLLDFQDNHDLSRQIYIYCGIR